MKLPFRKKTESGSNYLLGNSIGSFAVSNIIGGSKSINVLDEFLGFAWKCINVRATALASERIYIEKMVQGEWVETPHPFMDVLNGAEGDYDLYEFLEAHQISMDLYGESFWYFSKGDQTGVPMGRFLLDPKYMVVYVGGGRVTGYRYMYNGENLFLDNTEILHFRNYNPNNWYQYRGLGPMQAAGWFVKSDRYINTYVNNFMENNATPAGVIVAKGQVDNTDWKLFKQSWADTYGGVANAGKTGFVRGQELDFVKTGLSLGEMDLSKVKETSRDDVLAMFGVSKPMIGIFNEINRASAMTAKDLFASSFTDPALRRLAHKLTNTLVTNYGDGLRVNYSNPVPEDVDQELAKWTAGVNKWFTANEVRAYYGKDEMPGGDRLYVLNTEVPVDAVSDTAEKEPDEDDKAKTIGSIRIKTKTPVETKENFRARTEELQKGFEQKFCAIASPILEEQHKMVISQLKPKKITDTRFDAQQEADKLSEALLPLFVELAKIQGEMSIQFVSGKDASFKLDSVAEKYISDSIKKATFGFTQQTQEMLAKAVSDGLANGDSLKQIASNIGDIYKDMTGTTQPGYRLDRFARTEVIKASNEVSELSYKQSGVVERKEWFANPGACEYCAALNGSVIGISMSYVAQGDVLEGIDGGTRVNDYETIDHPPAHPSCRCVIIPVVEGV